MGTGNDKTCDSNSLFTGRGLVLALHLLSLACIEASHLTFKYFGKDLKRFFLIAGRALTAHLLGRFNSCNAEGCRNIVAWFDEELHRQSLATLESPSSKMWTCTSRVWRLWSFLEQAVPTLRAAAPPKGVVALLLALRLTSPILAPVFAVIGLFLHQPYLISLLLLATGYLLYFVYSKQSGKVKGSSLQRLASLVPSFYMDPSTRTLVGYSLSTVKHIQLSSEGLSKVVRLPSVLVYSSVSAVVSCKAWWF